jgi:type IV pilus assembly protein PilM
VSNPAAGGGAPAGGAEGQAAEDPGPQGEGWVLQLTGYHYHNREMAGGIQGAEYVRNTLLRNLHTGQILLPTADGQNRELVSLKDLGIGYPVLLDPRKVQVVPVVNPYAEPKKPETGTAEGTAQSTTMEAMPGGYTNMPGMSGMPGMMGGQSQGERVMLRRFDFVVQFCWQPTPPTERLEKKQEAQNTQAAPAPEGVTQAQP